MFNELMRSAVREAQIMDEREAAHEPRQAFVTRTEGNGVWVRFGTEDVTAPESWFTSTVVGVPVGTMGWVYPLAGGKGLFVVTNVFVPQTKYGLSSLSVVGSTAGTYVQDSPNSILEFTGLNPNRQYQITATVAILTTGSTVRSFRCTFEAVGATTVVPIPGSQNASYHNQKVSDLAMASLFPNADGVIVVRPAFTWVTGTVTANNFTILATIS